MKGSQALVAAAFWAKQRILRPSAYARYRRLLDSQSWDHSRVAEESLAKRRLLLAHAMDSSPFYARRLGGLGVEPGDIRSEEDWSALPVLKRADVQEHFGPIASRGTYRTVVSTTGGSTGHPVAVLHDLGFPKEVLSWRMLAWWSVSPGADAAFVWRETRGSRTSRFVNAAMWWPTRRIRLDAGALNEESMVRFLRDLNRLRPAYLQGYVGAIYELARFVTDQGIKVSPPGAIWVTSSPLSTKARTAVEEAFGAPCYDQYGTCEIHSLAAECRERNGLHVNQEARHLEVVHTEAGSSQGKIVVTDLENWAFPLIRYEIGDNGAWFSHEQCPCGVSLPRLNPVKGRVSDNLYLSSGQVLAGETLTTLFDDFVGTVEAFQVEQIEPDVIVIRLVPSRLPLEGALREVRRRLVTQTQGQLRVEFIQVARIAHDRGKIRYVLALPRPADDASIKG